MGRAMEVFQRVDRACTRFSPDSPLMRANGSPKRWHRVPETLFSALQEAKSAYDMTGGTFDPRVLRSLVALGYDHTLAFGHEKVVARGPSGPLRPVDGEAWRPRFRSGPGSTPARRVVLGRAPLDLGGIGKGLAVRWASEEMAAGYRSFLVDAGGDCYCSGDADEGGGWRVGVEDPLAPREHICVLALRDRAVATSSVRLRHWVAGKRRVHHLIDPRTGSPGGRGLLSVTVVGSDPARAEVWSKALFIGGRSAIRQEAEHRSIAALWVSEDGALSMSRAMERYLLWQRP